MADWCDKAEPKARLIVPELPPRCASCAFRRGPHLANGSPQALTDAAKCLIEGLPFYCHEPAREGLPCSGYLMMFLADERTEFRRRTVAMDRRHRIEKSPRRTGGMKVVRN